MGGMGKGIWKAGVVVRGLEPPGVGGENVRAPSPKGLAMPSDKPRDEGRPAAPPELARGQVIPASKLHIIGLILLSAFFAAVCGYLLYEWWFLPEHEGYLPFRLTWWGGILCAVGFGMGALGVLVLPFELVCPSQLILGDEAFQVVRRWPTGPEVQVHIPYANMKAVSCEKRDEAWQVGIDLRDPDDADTYAVEPGDLKQRDKAGHDYAFGGGYTSSFQEIARLLEKKRLRGGRKRDERLSGRDDY
jgi:hypothetical protein